MVDLTFKALLFSWRLTCRTKLIIYKHYTKSPLADISSFINDFLV
jgi:hypothetical protein